MYETLYAIDEGRRLVSVLWKWQIIAFN